MDPLEDQVSPLTVTMRLGPMTFVDMCGKYRTLPSSSKKGKSLAWTRGLIHLLRKLVCLIGTLSETYGFINILGFSEGLLTPRYVPVDIPQPAFRLNGEVQPTLYTQNPDGFRRAPIYC